MLSPCRWHYSHTKSYVPVRGPSWPRLQSQTSPNPPPSSRASNELPISPSPDQRDKTDRHTSARAPRSPHSLTHAIASHPSKRSRALSSQQPDQADPAQADRDDRPEHCWKRTAIAKKDRPQPVLVADLRTCLLHSPCLLSLFLSSKIYMLFCALGADRAVHPYPCRGLPQP